jgi:anti-sigma regulatory factor (Ser/Thr protein kinase)
VARGWVASSFAASLDRDELDRAKLVVSELVSNAVMHGSGQITVRGQLNEDRLLVEVVDEGTGFEWEIREHDFDRVGGWGLAIVDAVASRWGVHEGTTHVWFEIERPGPRLGSASKPAP